MSSSLVLLVVAPFLVLVVVFGVVVVVALCRANRDDIPAVVGECTAVFRWFAERLPGHRGGRDNKGADPGEGR